MENKTITLVYNPNAGSLKGDVTIIRQLESELRRSGYKVTALATASANDATRLARESATRRDDMLVVCGGDGTINETIQELAHSETTLAVFPCGTANVFARDLGMTPDPKKMSQMINLGKTATLSLGRASKPDSSWQRLFVLMAGIGLDAALVKNVSADLKRRIGIGAYFASALDYLARWPLTPFSLTINQTSYPATYATISNSPGFGGGFVMAPGARMDDDRLNACIFNSHSRLEYLGYAALALHGQHIKCDKVTYLETQSALALAPDATETWVQLDGELVGSLPMKFDVLPESLRVITA